MKLVERILLRSSGACDPFGEYRSGRFRCILPPLSKAHIITRTIPLPLLGSESLSRLGTLRLAMSTNDLSKRFKPKMSKTTRKPISSQESESGATLLEEPDGQIRLPYGQGVAHAKVSVQAGSGEALEISVISGPHGSGSFESAALSQSLVNRLRQKTDSLGSTLFRLTWKVRVTPSGRRIFALRASGRRTSDSDCTSWPTPDTNPEAPNTGLNRGKNWGGHRRRLTVCGLGNAAQLVAWQTPSVADGEGGHLSRSGNRRDEPLLPGQAKLAAWLTPQAGSPATDEYNEAGNTDSGRKTVALANWATPAHRDFRTANLRTYRERGGGKKGEQLQNQVQLTSWTTPRKSDSSTGSQYSENMTGKSLTMDASLSSWGTPRAQNARHGTMSPSEQRRHDPNELHRQVQLTDSGQTPNGSIAPTESTGQLNPAHSRWLQGLPKDWDDCADTATPSSPRSRKRSSKHT
jgi:hypothetical protein